MRIGYVFLLLCFTDGDACAQQAPGKNLTLTVTVASLSQTGDTVTIAYRLANASSSREPLESFFVDAPADGLSVPMPGPRTAWRVFTRYGEQPIAGWSLRDTSLVGAGRTSPNLSYRAIGAPAIVDAHIQGYRPVTELVEDSLRPDPDPMITNTIHVRVVGIAPLTPGATTPSALMQRIVAQEAEACALGWISNGGTCTSLQAKLSAAGSSLMRGEQNAARNELQAFLRELDALRGTHVDENAYHLLHTSADYLLSRL